MNLYKCRRCKGTWAMEKTTEKFWCPMCGNHETDMSPYLKPDPPDGMIVKAQEEYESLVWYKGTHPSDLKKLRMKIARLIQAGIQKNEQGIEAVRKEIEENKQLSNSGIRDNCSRFGRIRGSALNEGLKALERKVEEVRNDFYAIQGIKKLNEETQPQAKGGVALDKEGMPHDLIPGVSVVEFLPEMDKREALFLAPHYHDNPDRVAVVWLTGPAPGRLGSIYHDNFVWLRDLPFPQDSGSSKGGEG